MNSYTYYYDFGDYHGDITAKANTRKEADEKIINYKPEILENLVRVEEKLS